MRSCSRRAWDCIPRGIAGSTATVSCVSVVVVAVLAPADGDPERDGSVVADSDAAARSTEPVSAVFVAVVRLEGVRVGGDGVSRASK